jgi:S1-C subfamily serine protease
MLVTMNNARSMLARRGTNESQGIRFNRWPCIAGTRKEPRLTMGGEAGSRAVWDGLAEIVAVWGILVFFACTQARALAAQQEGPGSRTDTRAGAAVGARAGRNGAAAPASGTRAAVGGRRSALRSDNGTYRPTVVVRRGTSQGSGTIIASVLGETLILTAAHVVRNQGPIVVELHRYNLGVERAAAAGSWPRRVSAALAAADSAADLAVLRIENMRALPYVARLAPGNAAPVADTLVSSFGIDLGTELAAWSSRVVKTLNFEFNGSGESRPFLITDKIPEHGRSGGGLFLANGELVGVCVGHAELVEGRRMGIFASRESIRHLLDDHKLTAAVVRSNSRRARSGGRSTKVDEPAQASSRSVVTPTVSVGEKARAPDGP